jgi:hypothetical protein
VSPTDVNATTPQARLALSDGWWRPASFRRQPGLEGPRRARRRHLHRRCRRRRYLLPLVAAFLPTALKTLACADAYPRTAADTPPEPPASSTATSASPTAQPFLDPPQPVLKCSKVPQRA